MQAKMTDMKFPNVSKSDIQILHLTKLTCTILGGLHKIYGM